MSRITDAERARLTALAPAARLVFHDGATDETYRELLRGATALVTASRDEGFGIPLVEAMGLGTPVVVSDIPVFREVGGDAGDVRRPRRRGRLRRPRCASSTTRRCWARPLGRRPGARRPLHLGGLGPHPAGPAGAHVAAARPSSRAGSAPGRERRAVFSPGAALTGGAPGQAARRSASARPRTRW